MSSKKRNQFSSGQSDHSLKPAQKVVIIIFLIIVIFSMTGLMTAASLGTL